MGFKQRILTKIHDEILVLQKEIETCGNDKESLTKEISELEIIYNQTFNRIQTLEKDLAETKVKINIKED